MKRPLRAIKCLLLARNVLNFTPQINLEYPQIIEGDTDGVSTLFICRKVLTSSTASAGKADLPQYADGGFAGASDA